MKTTQLLTALIVFIISLNGFAGPRNRRGGHGNAPTGGNSSSRKSSGIADSEKDVYGKQAPDKSVQWGYTVTVEPGASLNDIRKLKSALKKAGAKFNWGTQDEPVFGIESYLSLDEIKSMGPVKSVDQAEETKNFSITLAKNVNWSQLKKELTENRMQVTYRPEVVPPPYVVVKSSVLEIGRIWALLRKHIEPDESQEPSVKEL